MQTQCLFLSAFHSVVGKKSPLNVGKGDQEIPLARDNRASAVQQVSRVQQNFALFQSHILVHRGDIGAATKVGVAL